MGQWIITITGAMFLADYGVTVYYRAMAVHDSRNAFKEGWKEASEVGDKRRDALRMAIYKLADDVYKFTEDEQDTPNVEEERSTKNLEKEPKDLSEDWRVWTNS